MKRALYEELIKRIDSAMEKGSHFEASWYCYAVIEDRLISLLRNSGGIEKNDKKIRMLGPKLRELKGRAKSDSALSINFNHDAIHDWKESRDDLQHAMAEGGMSIEDVDREGDRLASSGRALVREVAASAMRFKKLAKQRDKATT